MPWLWPCQADLGVEFGVAIAYAWLNRAYWDRMVLIDRNVGLELLMITHRYGFSLCAVHVEPCLAWLTDFASLKGLRKPQTLWILDPVLT